MGFLEAIQTYVTTTPYDVMAAHALFVISPTVIVGVIIWGLIQLWLDNKQGQYWTNIKWVLLSVNVPQDAVQSPKGMENFFNLLAGSKSSITWKEKWMLGKFQAYFVLEIVSKDGRISFYIRTPVKYRDLVEASFYAQYPEAQIVEVEDNYFDYIPDTYPDEEYDLWGSEMVLRKPSYLPIKTYEMFEHQGEKDLRFKDPLLSLLENMGKMRPGETYMLQIMMMQPDEQDWVKEGRKYIEKIYGLESPKKKSGLLDSLIWFPQEMLTQSVGLEFSPAEAAKQDDFKMFKLTPEERDQLDAIKEKISKIGWMTKIRFVYVAKRELFRKGSIASMTKGVFHQFAHQNWNKLGIHGDSTPKDDYFFQEWQMPSKQKRLISRYKNRSFGPGSTPYFLNTAELATLFHFPSADARTPVLTAVGARRSEAPIELGFAAEGAPILQNVERTDSGEQAPLAPGAPRPQVQAGPLAVPQIGAPTRPRQAVQTPPATPTDSAFDQPQPVPTPVVAPPQQEQIPQAGMAAPLPPGLDLTDQSLPPQEAPENLPVE